MTAVTRRGFLAAGGLLGGGLLLGYLVTPERLGVKASANARGRWLATWIRIDSDDRVLILVPHAEMGQGVHTSLAMMAAEELDADWSQIDVEQAPAEGLYATGDMVRGFMIGAVDIPFALRRHLDYASYKLADLMHLQVTGGSASVRFTGHWGMRRAGAAARNMLMQAAASRWGVALSACASRQGRIYLRGSARYASYGELAADAVRMPLPSAVKLKDPASYVICGRSLPRLDVVAKTDAKPLYGIDVRLPAMQYAAIRQAPVFGGSLVSVDPSQVTRQKGVYQVIELDNAVAVVADGYWRARQALNALPVEFGAGANGEFNSESMFNEFKQLLTNGREETDLNQGQAEEYLQSAADVITVDYQVPFLAHATMEPMNCSAWYDGERLHIWSGAQDLLGARAAAAKAADLAMEKVTVHAVQLGGGFGRRLSNGFGYIEQGAKVAMRTAAPVKLIWSREEDVQHDVYRPATSSRLRSNLGTNGRPLTWSNRYIDIGYNEDREAAFVPYAIPHQHVGRIEVEVPVPLGYWRSVEHSYQGFFIESFIDELAAAADIDPLRYRLSLLQHRPRFRKVLEVAARTIGWGRETHPCWGRGIAVKECFGTIVAQAAEVAIGADGRIEVKRIVAAVDPGEVINPDIAGAQVEGGIIFGLSATLFGEISIRNGQVMQANFPSYEMLRLANTPEIDVKFLTSGGQIGGMGEVGVPCVAAAVCNAIFAASGRRVRRLPLAGGQLGV